MITGQFMIDVSDSEGMGLESKPSCIVADARCRVHALSRY